jgi:hypothetical protein
MDKLPQDIFGCISDFLTIQEIGNTLQTIRNFTNTYLLRKKRFHYCLNKIKPRKITDGRCSDHRCTHMKLSCINLNPEPIETQILSLYCSKHTKRYLDIELNDLF